jgi:hypothetical protein
MMSFFGYLLLGIYAKIISAREIVTCWGGAQYLVSNCKDVSIEAHPQNCKPMIPGVVCMLAHTFSGLCTYMHNASSDREELAEVKVKLG